MSATSTSASTSHTLARAEEAIERRRSRLTFPSARRALEWMFETGPRMQAPHGMHPKTSPLSVLVDGVPRPTDTRVVVEVDGGQGGDLDEVFATLATINSALNACHRDLPQGCAGLVLVVRDGRSQASVADAYRMPQQSLSREIGKAESFLQGALRAAGVVR